MVNLLVWMGVGVAVGWLGRWLEDSPAPRGMAGDPLVGGLLASAGALLGGLLASAWQLAGGLHILALFVALDGALLLLGVAAGTLWVPAAPAGGGGDRPERRLRAGPVWYNASWMRVHPPDRWPPSVDAGF